MSSLQAKVKRMDMQAQANVFIALKALSGPIEQYVKKELSRRKSGPIVHRSRPSRRVRVSLPYEAPAKDMGMLVSSIDVDVDPQQYNMTISAFAPYARELEYGTRKMLPRPFLRPALTHWRPAIVDAIREAVRRSV